VHTVSSPAADLLKEAESQGFKPDLKFICLNWCADEAFIQLAGQAAEDVIGAIPFAPPGLRAAGHEDAAAWLAENGASLDEKGLHYTQGWWTMAIMLEGVRRVVNGGQEVSRENLKAVLETIQDFNTGGVTAPISFSPTSHTGNHALRLYQVHDGKWKLISDTISSDR
jgi:branched-chain amino acid transport system substrate-binding protein